MKKKYIILFFSLLFLILFLFLGIYSLVLSCRLAKLLDDTENSFLVTTKVDFSTKSRYSIVFKNKHFPVYKLYEMTYIVTPSFPSNKDPYDILSELKGVIRIKSGSKIIAEWKLEELIRWDRDGSVVWRLYEALGKKEYTLEIEIIEAVANLNKYKQKIVFNYGILHERTMFKVSRVLAIFSCIFFFLLLVFLVKVKKQGNQQNETKYEN